MDLFELKNLISLSYEMEICYIEKIKNVYRLMTNEKEYCLKVINYELPHFLFIFSAIKHLQNNGFDKIPEIITTAKGEEYICLENKFAYLTEWVCARQCSYDNPIDLSSATKKLAELHKKSEGFTIDEKMKPRIGWFKWIETYKTRKDEILGFRKKIESKSLKTEFDCMYLSIINDEIKRAEKSVTNLIKSQYLDSMEKQIAKKNFCHHDYAHHNILIEKNGRVNIIDFDYCILDTPLHDLASLLIRRMKNGKWDIANSSYILNYYSKINSIEKTDIPIMAAFMEFPQDYWQVGIQYYWENQPWGEEFFINKLEKIIEDREEKEEFIEDFRVFKYS